ncbi:coiled-coil domain-containing protein 1-like [Hydractinia symbiolongicarpus]|uniref:coiled-coil domain-containing protein 1-like n=1 Tax=Hydractinia symbiolongicarpus TaxID=13093 RepID=UPI0025514769|nr:coiled-coil domain-containing protein 1-like [Hydractinia symbiolongicarpus]
MKMEKYHLKKQGFSLEMIQIRKALLQAYEVGRFYKAHKEKKDLAMKFAVILATLVVVSLGTPIYEDEYNADRLAKDAIDADNAAVESDTHKSIDLAARESDHLNNGWGDAFSFSKDSEKDNSQEDASSVNDAENTSDNVEYDLEVQEDMLDDVDDVLEENTEDLEKSEDDVVNLEDSSEDVSDDLDDASENVSDDLDKASENVSNDIEDASEDEFDDAEDVSEDSGYITIRRRVGR